MVSTKRHLNIKWKWIFCIYILNGILQTIKTPFIGNIRDGQADGLVQGLTTLLAGVTPSTPIDTSQLAPDRFRATNPCLLYTSRCV